MILSSRAEYLRGAFNLLPSSRGLKARYFSEYTREKEVKTRSFLNSLVSPFPSHLSYLSEYKAKYSLHLCASALMRNHGHFLLEVKEVLLSRIMQVLQFRYTRYLNKGLQVATAKLSDRANKDWGETGLDTPVSNLVGMSQSIARDLAPNAHMI
jgi:hypothetical protein